MVGVHTAKVMKLPVPANACGIRGLYFLNETCRNSTPTCTNIQERSMDSFSTTGLLIGLLSPTQIQSLKMTIASFPGRSHLQYLIACSMQIRRRKAWEIWSRAVTSGRQMVDTRGAVPNSSNSCFVSNRPWRCE